MAQIDTSFWRSPNLSASLSDRIQLAEAGIEVAKSELSSGRFISEDPAHTPEFYAVMAEFDLATNGTKYRADLLSYVNFTQTTFPDFSDKLTSVCTLLLFSNHKLTPARKQGFNYKALLYGYAAIQAYRAYSDTAFLDYAVEAWNRGNNFTLSVAATDFPPKVVTLKTECDGSNVVGATFNRNENSTGIGDTFSDSETTGLFVALSSHLYDTTSSPIYLQSAQRGFDFIHAHLYNDRHLIKDGIRLDNCVPSEQTQPFTLGLVVESLAILCSSASTPCDSVLETMLEETITAAMSTREWLGTQGIITNPNSASGDIQLPRSLQVVHSRNATSVELLQQIEKFLAVQFNAVAELAAAPGTNLYSSIWSGPPPSTFDGLAQTSALSTLVNAIHIPVTGDATSTSGASPTAPTPSASITSSGSKSAPRTPIILASVVGSIVVLFLGTFVLWLFRRKARAASSRRSRTSSLEPFPSDLESEHPGEKPPRYTPRREAEPTPRPWVFPGKRRNPPPGPVLPPRVYTGSSGRSGSSQSIPQAIINPNAASPGGNNTMLPLYSVEAGNR
ncbi:Glycoside hydrolase family 76 protein [Mycena kentingensis (nom. inval.)]|nr:Glycoside hydrolase family 76 protein [Mycena kentingensis (nom. inval.)]